jgi:hypothetical protein
MIKWSLMVIRDTLHTEHHDDHGLHHPKSEEIRSILAPYMAHHPGEMVMHLYMTCHAVSDMDAVQHVRKPHPVLSWLDGLSKPHHGKISETESVLAMLLDQMRMTYVQPGDSVPVLDPSWVRLDVCIPMMTGHDPAACPRFDGWAQVFRKRCTDYRTLVQEDSNDVFSASDRETMDYVTRVLPSSPRDVQSACFHACMRMDANWIRPHPEPEIHDINRVMRTCRRHHHMTTERGVDLVQRIYGSVPNIVLASIQNDWWSDPSLDEQTMAHLRGILHPIAMQCIDPQEWPSTRPFVTEATRLILDHTDSKEHGVTEDLMIARLARCVDPDSWTESPWLWSQRCTRARMATMADPIMTEADMLDAMVITGWVIHDDRDRWTRIARGLATDPEHNREMTRLILAN